MTEENQQTESVEFVIASVTDHLRETVRGRIIDLPRWMQ